ncbi:hypothetical protein F5883DRAFT_650059 [Diaporthe sp. PMI_573]|nr:hypothetical protein F5883DRAFT_650059 [Diaporthaceae sp. PMI_573]
MLKLVHRLKFSGEPDRLKYFHFPANHMGWVERAIARYYHEDHSDLDVRTRTKNLLSRENWRGRQRGGGLGKGRHLQPGFCRIQMRDPYGLSTQRSSPSLAIFASPRNSPALAIRRS